MAEFDPEKFARFKAEVNGSAGPSLKFDPEKLKQTKSTVEPIQELKRIGKETLSGVRAAQSPIGALGVVPSIMAAGGRALERTFPGKAAEISERMAERGVPPRIAAGTGMAISTAKFFAPKTQLEASLSLLGPELGAAGLSYVKRVTPMLTNLIFPSIGKAGAEALGKAPGKVASLASKGEEFIARKELEQVNKIRVAVDGIIENVGKKFGETKRKILAQAGDKTLDASGLQKGSFQTLSEYNFLPELKTAQAADPKLQRVFQSVSDDIEEFATRPGDIKVSEFMDFSKNLSTALRSNLSRQAKGGIQKVKDLVDIEIKKGLGDELFKTHKINNEIYAKQIEAHRLLSRLVKKPSAAKKIIRESEGLSEIGLKLKDFIKDASLLDELSLISASRAFAPKPLVGVGASFPSLVVSSLAAAPQFLPGATLAGRAGLPVTRLGIARFAEAAQRVAPFSIGAGATLAPAPTRRVFK